MIYTLELDNFTYQMLFSKNDVLIIFIVCVGVGYGIVMPQGSLLCAFSEDRILPAVSQMETYCETLSGLRKSRGT